MSRYYKFCTQIIQFVQMTHKLRQENHTDFRVIQNRWLLVLKITIQKCLILSLCLKQKTLQMIKALPAALAFKQ